MIKVDLTTEQASELRNYYINELERLQKRSTEILNLLKAIGQVSPESAQPKQAPLSGQEPIKEPVERKPPEHQSASPSWSKYIIKLLNERERAVTREQIFKSYQKEFNVEFSDPKVVKNTLSQALHYLQNTKNLIEGEPRKGKRGNIYRLIQEKPAKKEKGVKAEKQVAPPKE